MHSKEWFSICAMVFVVLKDSIFVFEDHSKHFFLGLSHVSIKIHIMNSILTSIVNVPTTLLFYEMQYFHFEKHPVVLYD